MAANRNGIKKGTKVEVDPVRDIKDIKAISIMLKANPRNHLLWVMGINNGLRANDLVKVKIADVKNLKPGDALNIIESKTGKTNVLVINKTVFKALHIFFDQVTHCDNDYLFKSRKGGHISSQSVGRLVKTWTAAINLPGNYGAHTLRKTWGYQQRVQYGAGIEIICKRYNHSTPAITMRYLGIEDKEIHNLLMNEI